MVQSEYGWYAISRNGIIGPYFFDGNDTAVSVNSARYLTMVQEFFLPELDEMELDDVWFHRTGQLPTQHREWVMEFLRERLKVITPWEAIWSTRYSPLLFFPVGYLKSKVHNERPTTLEALKNNIRANTTELPVEMLGRVHENFGKRLLQCIQSKGSHL